MANAYSTSDLVKGTLQRCGEVTDGSSPYHALALKYLNTVYQGILSGSNEFSEGVGIPWTWARTSASFVLPGYENTGTITLTFNSTAGVFSQAPTISLQGYFINVLNSRTWYRIATHTASSVNFTLDSIYLNTTSTDPSGSGLSYIAVPLIIDLATVVGNSQILRLVEPFRLQQDRVLEFLEGHEQMGQIYFISLDKFRQKWPLKLLVNDIPSVATTVYRSETSWQVQFNKYVTNPIRLDFDFIEIQPDLVDSDLCIPILPREYREILEFGATYYLLQDKEEDQKSMKYFGLTKAKLDAMQTAEEKTLKQTGNNYGRLVPRMDDSANPWWLITAH